MVFWVGVTTMGVPVLTAMSLVPSLTTLLVMVPPVHSKVGVRVTLEPNATVLALGLSTALGNRVSVGLMVTVALAVVLSCLG